MAAPGAVEIDDTTSDDADETPLDMEEVRRRLMPGKDKCRAQLQRQRTGPELPATIRKRPVPGSAAVTESGDDEGEGEEVFVRHPSASAPESAPETAPEPDSPIRPTIGERNKRNPRDRSLNSDEQRMRAARLDGAQRPKKRRQPDLTQVAEEAAREECAAGATLSGAEEAAAAQEEADADADADADAQDPEVTGRPTRPESDRRKVDWVRNGAPQLLTMLLTMLTPTFPARAS